MDIAHLTPESAFIHFFMLKLIFMKPDDILQSNMLDILFENRNKTYGAYVLRRDYEKRVKKSLALMLLFVSAVVLLFSIPKNKSALNFTIYETAPAYVPVDLPKDVQPKPKMPEKPKAAAPAKQAPSQQFNNRINIVDDRMAATKLPSNLDSVEIDNTTRPGIPGTTPVVKIPHSIPVIPGTGTGGDVKKTGADQPLAFAEVMPSFPGGVEALKRFLEKNLNTPSDFNAGEMVSVKVKFVVGIDGKLKSFEVTEDGGAEFNQEVIRVLKKMPDWIPGKTKGENVSVYFTLPVKFMPAE